MPTDQENISDLRAIKSESPAHRFYLALCRAISGRLDQVDWQAFSDSDWANLARLANGEGVSYLLYRALKESAIQVKEVYLNELKHNSFVTKLQNQILYDQLKKILPEFARNNIPVILIKGIALASSLYPDIGMRPMGDIDLIVHKTDVVSALSMLQAMGFQRHSTKGEGFNDLAGLEIALYRPGNPVIFLEIHWNLIAGDLDWRSPSIEWFWQHTQPYNLPGQAWQGGALAPMMLTTEAQLLYSAAHATLQHSLVHSRLIWFYDLHLLITKAQDTMDWAEILAICQEFRWTDALLAALQASQRFFATPVPAAVLDALKNMHDEEAASLISKMSSRSRNPVNVLEEKLSTSNWGGRFGIILVNLFPNPQFIKRRYNPNPAWTWPIYYPYRWCNAIAQLLESAWRRLQKKY